MAKRKRRKKKKAKGILNWVWKIWQFLLCMFLHIFYIAASLILKAAELILKKSAAFLSLLLQKRKEKPQRDKDQGTAKSFSPFSVQKKISGDIGEFEKRVYSQDSTIGLILGARGSGKSALGMRMLENAAAKSQKKVCAMGFDSTTLPGWIHCIQSTKQVPNNSFVLVDEGGITFSSRSFQSSANKLLSSLILVARHKDVSVLFISQNSANLEINAIRQADYLLLRKPSLLQKDFERKKIARIYSNAQGGFENLPNQGKHSTYIYSDEFRGFVENDLPTFWSLKISKSFESLQA